MARNIRPHPALLLALALTAVATLFAASTGSPAAAMNSTVIDWEKHVFVPTKTGARAQVFDAPTGTLDKFLCHITTLNPGQNTGVPHRHPQEELVIVREGKLEVNIDGHKHVAGPGAMIFFAVNESENMTSVGTTPATYYVLQWYTPLTPKR